MKKVLWNMAIRKGILGLTATAILAGCAVGYTPKPEEPIVTEPVVQEVTETPEPTIEVLITAPFAILTSLLTIVGPTIIALGPTLTFFPNKILPNSLALEEIVTLLLAAISS